MKFPRMPVLALCALLPLTSGAVPITSTQNLTTTFSPSEVSVFAPFFSGAGASQTLNNSGAATFNLFDAGLGALSQVDISVSTSMVGMNFTGSINDGDFASALPVQLGASYGWSAGHGFSVGSVSESNSTNRTHADGCSGSNSCSFNGNPAGSVVSDIVINDIFSFTGGDLASFIGPGTFDVVTDVFLSAETTSTSAAPAFGSVIANALNASSIISVSYTYEQAPPPMGVPEPGVLPLLLLGLTFVGTLKRSALPWYA